MNTLTKEEMKEYYQRCMAILEQQPEITAQIPGIIYEIQSSYYSKTGDYLQALIALDSTIAYRKQYARPIDLISPLYEKTNCYEKIGDFKNAFYSLLLADSLQKDIKMEEARKNTDEMQARFGVDKLELEKAQLSARNRLIILYAAIAFLLCLIIWITYLIHTMRRLHKTQKKLLDSNAEIIRQKEKVMVSEEMKTCFIQSMCHEIRTPLNAINGFSKLLLDESIATNDKTEFPHIIQENTESLTNIIDNMLDMSTLITSNEKLPTEEVCICQICSDAIQRRKDVATDSSGLTFKLDVAQKWPFPQIIGIYPKLLNTYWIMQLNSLKPEISH
mgnify:CR=1 FL=1